MADDNRAKSEKKKTMDRIKKRKKSFDFARIGKATKKNADDLQIIKGIGPYSEEKLNALGIFTYEQLANFDPKTEEDVNDAIEHYKDVFVATSGSSRPATSLERKQRPTRRP